MKTTLLSAAAALALISMSPVSSFAQQQNGDNGYQASQNGGYGNQNRGDYGRRSEERQNNPYMDRTGDRMDNMNSMMSRRSGARFRFRRGDGFIDIRCPANDSLQDCVEAASRLIDKVRSLGPGAQNRQGPAPGPDNRPAPGAMPNQHSE